MPDAKNNSITHSDRAGVFIQGNNNDVQKNRVSEAAYGVLKVSGSTGKHHTQQRFLQHRHRAGPRETGKPSLALPVIPRGLILRRPQLPKGERPATHGYGGKLKDLSDGVIHRVTTRVFRLFSASEASGIGAYGLMATFTATESLFFGSVASMIL